jgi:hypothetical protein
VTLLTNKADAEEKPNDEKRKIVILGSGWGCVGVLKGLKAKFWERKSSDYEVVVVSPSNFSSQFLFLLIMNSIILKCVSSLHNIFSFSQDLIFSLLLCFLGMIIFQTLHNNYLHNEGIEC